MGSRFKKSVISENVRKSLSKWQRRVKGRHSSAATPVTTSPELMMYEAVNLNEYAVNSEEGSSSGTKDSCFSHDYDDASASETLRIEALPNYQNYQEHDIERDSSPSLH